MKILIIDPSIITREFIKKELSSLPDIEFMEATSCQEGLDKAFHHEPDLITTSFFLEDRDGLELAREIRDHATLSHTPIIIITSSTDERLVKRSFDIGNVDFFIKPFHPGELLKFVEDLFLRDPIFQGLNVLVVDDSVVVLKIMSRVLRYAGVNVIEASDGSEAINILSQGVDVHLIITDYIMPEVDGFKLCEYVRQQLNRADIPIIILTAYGDQYTVTKGIKAGATDYLLKPFSRDELIARIHNHAMMIRSHLQLQEEIKERKYREEQMNEELEQARETQKSLLPEQIPQIPNAVIACKYISMEKIGGDFYDIFQLDDDKYGFMVTDVTGHGVSAALIAFMVSGIFSEAIKSGTSTELVMNLTNGMLQGKLQEGKFASMIYLIYDASTRMLTYTTAGHPDALVIRPETNEVFPLHTRGMLVGVFPNEIANYEEKQFQMIPGDKLLLYTDAITEVIDENQQLLSTHGLISFLQENRHLHIRSILEEVYKFGLKYSQKKEFDDDFTTVGLEILS